MILRFLREWYLPLLLLAALIALLCCYRLCFPPPDSEWKSYDTVLDGEAVTWGCFTFASQIPTEPEVRVEYLLPRDYDAAAISTVFYAPFGNAKNALMRPQLYELTTRNGMLLFTVAFDYEIDKTLPMELQRSYASSGWYEKIFEIKEILEDELDIPHRKLFIFGDSSGAVMSHGMSRHMPDQIEAAAWISSGVAYNYEEASHPPLLAISTWGDSGHDDMRAVVASDNANGGYSLFMTGPPSWPEKGYSCFHHGGHNLDYALICEFFGNIAALRRQNGFVSVPVSEWPEEIEFAGRLVKAPGAGFKVKWEEYPHAEIPDLVERGLTPGSGLLKLAIPAADSGKAVLFIQPGSWYDELWPVDNLFFLAENGFLACSANLTIDESGYENAMRETLAEFFADADIGERPVTVIAGGNVGPVLYRCIESLPDGQKLRITRQIYLNPPESDFELLRGKNVEIWSNSPVCLENDGKSGFHYTQHAGESYGHYYFDVLKSVLDYEP